MLRAALTVSRNDLHEEPQQLRRRFDAAARRLALLELRADPHGRAADLHEVRCPIVSGASDRKDYRYEACLANVRTSDVYRCAKERPSRADSHTRAVPDGCVGPARGCGRTDPRRGLPARAFAATTHMMHVCKCASAPPHPRLRHVCRRRRHRRLNHARARNHTRTSPRVGAYILDFTLLFAIFGLEFEAPLRGQVPARAGQASYAKLAEWHRAARSSPDRLQLIDRPFELRTHASQPAQVRSGRVRGVKLLTALLLIRGRLGYTSLL